ncbi:MAG: M28 family peptidase [Verrucomicrobiales bacterium]
MPRPTLFALALLALASIVFPGCGGKKSANKHGFSGERAMRHVEAVVGFGPRPAGSEALETTRQYIESELASLGWAVSRQPFTKTTQLMGKVGFVNLRARLETPGTEIDWNKGGGMIVVASHYDTKWFEDIEFVGANDAGSSTGALIELARVLGEQHPDIARRVELVFFDGEEAFGENITPTDGLYGSHYYARRLWRPLPAADKPSHGILLDMIGDKDLLLTPPPNSGAGLVELAIESAKHLGYGDYIEPGRTAIIDDHVPLNTEARFPSVDLIDFTYPAWHKKFDTLDRISAESLEITGEITIEMLRRLLEE